MPGHLRRSLISIASGQRRPGRRHSTEDVDPVYRLIYEPLRTYLLYASAIAVLRGRPVGWNKVPRANSVRLVDIQVPAPAAGTS